MNVHVCLRKGHCLYVCERTQHECMWSVDSDEQEHEELVHTELGELTKRYVWLWG